MSLQNSRATVTKQEVAIISLADGGIRLATAEGAKEQLATVEQRYLHVAVEVAADHSIPAVGAVAKNIFEDQKNSLPARLQADEYVWQRGDIRGRKLIHEVTAIESQNPFNVQVQGLDANLLFDPDYWWDTVRFARRVKDELKAR